MSVLIDEGYLSLEEFKVDFPEPQACGLGFVCINHKDDPDIRWNFYHPDLWVVKSYHDHRSSFSSKIIKGELTQQIIAYEKTNKITEWELLETNCIDSGKIINNFGYVETCFLVRHSLKKNQVYHLGYRAMHRVQFNKPVVTKMKIDRNAWFRNNFTIKHTEDKFLCPINDFKKSIDDCWTIVEEVLSYR